MRGAPRRAVRAAARIPRPRPNLRQGLLLDPRPVLLPSLPPGTTPDPRADRRDRHQLAPPRRPRPRRGTFLSTVAIDGAGARRQERRAEHRRRTCSPCRGAVFSAGAGSTASGRLCTVESRFPSRSGFLSRGAACSPVVWRRGREERHEQSRCGRLRSGDVPPLDNGKAPTVSRNPATAPKRRDRNQAAGTAGRRF